MIHLLTNLKIVIQILQIKYRLFKWILICMPKLALTFHTRRETVWCISVSNQPIKMLRYSSCNFIGGLTTFWYKPISFLGVRLILLTLGHEYNILKTLTNLLLNKYKLASPVASAANKYSSEHMHKYRFVRAFFVRMSGIWT